MQLSKENIMWRKSENILERHQNPLKWWEDHDKHYTLLSVLAQKYLSIPGTSMPSERLFSKAGELPYIMNRYQKKTFADFASLGAFMNIFLHYFLLITKKFN